MGSKKTLTFFYSIYNPTIIELNYINKLINYIKKNQLLTEEIDIVIFDDTDNNKYKNYFMDNKVKVLNVQENVKKNKALFYSIDKINSKYLKIVDPDDFLVFDFLEKVINKLKLIDADFILHPFFKLKDNKIKYQNFKEVRYYNFNTIYSVDKIKKEKNLINIDLLYNQDQYLGMIVDLNSSYQKINIPFYIYNRNSFSSIWNNLKYNYSYKYKNIDQIINDTEKNIQFYNLNYKKLSKGVKPRFIRSLFLKQKFKNRYQIYKYVKSKIKTKRININLWILFACFLKFKWI